jgi:hypothetical protein
MKKEHRSSERCSGCGIKSHPGAGTPEIRVWYRTINP